MKETLKKILGTALAATMLMQIVLPVAGQSSLQTANVESTGTIRIHRFAGSTEANPTQGTPLNNIPYTVTRVRLQNGVDPTPLNLRDPDNFDVITGNGAHSETQSTVNGVATFSDLPIGLYLVTEGTHTITPESDRVAPFVVGIPRRVNDEWIYDVDVYPKSDEDSPTVFDKELELVWDEALGEMVAEWTLETTIPRLIGNATRFEFIDPLDQRLTFIPDSVVGTFYRLEEIDDTLTEVAQTLPADAFQVNLDENNVLSIALTQVGFSTLSQHAILAPNGTLTFTFRTAVSAAEADLGPITNSARLYYNEDEGQYTETPPPVEYHFGMEIEKVDVNGERLSEATFEVFLDEDLTIPAFPESGGNRSFTTFGGVVFIPGLQAGVYYLQETASPEGYRLITDAMRVVVDHDYTDAPSRPFIVTLQVVNQLEGDFYLPQTGGIGTVLFTAAGLSIIGGSLVMAAKNRRKNNDEHFDT